MTKRMERMERMEMSDDNSDSSSDSSIEMWAPEPPKNTAKLRTRRAPRKQQVEFGLASEEETMIRLALQRSCKDVKLQVDEPLPSCRVFYPTIEEFAEPLKYIQKIAPEGRKTGIAKIVPPAGWNPPSMIDFEDNKVKIETKLQRLHHLQEGKEYSNGRKHTLKSYRKAADTFKEQWLARMNRTELNITSPDIEKEYWKLVETSYLPTQVEYANDIDNGLVGSCFPRTRKNIKSMLRKSPTENVDFTSRDYYETTAWNLNNLPFAPESCLSHVNARVNGINIPWMYFGTLFATFCWHCEDNYMYSINYMHSGAKKHWYGIPATDCAKFESAWKATMPERFKEDPDLFFHLVTMVSPFVAKRNKVNVYSLIQEPGQFVVTFPQGYHCGFSEGFNCSEAVNFALPDWIPYARICNDRYRLHNRTSVFPHDRLMYLLATKIKLDYATIEGCEHLLDELVLLAKEERDYRESYTEDGISTIVVMPPTDVALNEKTMAEDDEKQCCVCSHSVFFSGIVCACSPIKVACLRHGPKMCKCAMELKSFVEWISLDTLEKAVVRVSELLQELDTRQLKRALSDPYHLPPSKRVLPPSSSNIVTY
ncbi:histone demethylase [Thraustotheca clavata]|uniref:Histone demethylase n=1 Tax=Thraustotheca clavata TaxID=74557 RepID=A0A1V9ZSS4_9STRA|nr:histone demethylase [Thraustotheca clavata]